MERQNRKIQKEIDDIKSTIHILRNTKAYCGFVGVFLGTFINYVIYEWSILENTDEAVQQRRIAEERHRIATAALIQEQTRQREAAYLLAQTKAEIARKKKEEN